jgi:hypothetical protein
MGGIQGDLIIMEKGQSARQHHRHDFSRGDLGVPGQEWAAVESGDLVRDWDRWLGAITPQLGWNRLFPRLHAWTRVSPTPPHRPVILGAATTPNGEAS